jgi:hypothetical protein
MLEENSAAKVTAPDKSALIRPLDGGGTAS